MRFLRGKHIPIVLKQSEKQKGTKGGQKKFLFPSEDRLLHSFFQKHWNAAKILCCGFPNAIISQGLFWYVSDYTSVFIALIWEDCEVSVDENRIYVLYFYLGESNLIVFGFNLILMQPVPVYWHMRMCELKESSKITMNITMNILQWNCASTMKCLYLSSRNRNFS